MQYRYYLVLILLSWCATAWALATHTTGLHAVPTQGAVQIDGQLAEWDLSGRVLICADLEALKDRYSAQASLMYDADNLYVALQWKDPVPMGNQHDHNTCNFGWAGDCVQLRLLTDRTVPALPGTTSGYPCVTYPRHAETRCQAPGKGTGRHAVGRCHPRC